MKGISKLIIILILLVSTTVIVLMSIGSFGISNRAMEKSEAVDLSKSIAEMFASVDTDDDFIELLDEEWEPQDGEDITVYEDIDNNTFVNIQEEIIDEPEFMELIYSASDLGAINDIIVYVDGKTAFINIEEEKTDEGVIRHANIEVFVGGESTYILNTSKYVSSEKEQL